MRVPSPGQDISRTHVKVAPGQWGIEVTDMHSTNGTVVLLLSHLSFAAQEP